MGAESFETRARGISAKAAFETAVQEAQYERGHGGYTGTIAEKTEFVEIAVPAGIDPEDYVEMLMRKNDPRVRDKWGPAGCVCLTGDSGAKALPSSNLPVAAGATVLESKQVHEYLFFGWASC